MDLYQIEIRLLSGFIRDRHLITLASTEGFHVDLLASPLARRLAKVIIDLYAVQDAVVDESTLRVHLVDRGLLTPEMERYLANVIENPPLSAGEAMAQVDVLKARESRDLLGQVHESIGGYLYRQDGQQSDIVQFTADCVHNLMEIQRRRIRRQVAPISEAFSPLLESRPVASDSHMGSIKSGPFLKACTARPRWRKAAHRPMLSVVLPEDLWAAEMSRRFMPPLYKIILEPQINADEL